MLEELGGLFSIVLIILIVVGLMSVLYFVPVRLWITAVFSGVKLKLFRDLVGMRLRQVPPAIIVRSLITAHKAGIYVETPMLEAHFLAGGQVQQVVNALISAQKANIDLTFERATAIDLAGRDVADYPICAGSRGEPWGALSVGLSGPEAGVLSAFSGRGWS